MSAPFGGNCGPAAAAGATPFAGMAGRVEIVVSVQATGGPAARSSRWTAPGSSTYSRSSVPQRIARMPVRLETAAKSGGMGPVGSTSCARLAAVTVPVSGSLFVGSVTQSRRHRPAVPSQRDRPQLSEYHTRVVPTASWVTLSAVRNRTAGLE